MKNNKENLQIHQHDLDDRISFLHSQYELSPHIKNVQ